jgi:phage tail-like protein
MESHNFHFDEVVMPTGDGASTLRKIPGLTNYSNIVLKCGITDSLELYIWYMDIEERKINSCRKSVVITLLRH